MLFPTIEFIIFALLTLTIWWHCGELNENKKIGLLVVFNTLFYANLNIALPLYLLGWTTVIYIGSKYTKWGALCFAIFQLVFWKSIEAGFILFDYKTPLGLSFFTFQGLTYLFGIWKLPKSKEDLHIQEPWTFFKLFAFIGFFPTLLSGPILRASRWNIQEKTIFDMDRINKALSYILIGFFYKICISSILHDYSVEAFANPDDSSSSLLIIGMYAYTFEIYTDFAGYSLMALGVAYLYGFNVPLNFDKPYFTTNVREFWTKWHISFSSWLRDYLYFSIGGSKLGKLRHYLNLMVVMVACGFWHGFSPTYVSWGLLQGFGIVGTHLISNHIKINKYIAWIINFHFICISWLLFRSPDLNTFISYINTMCSNLSTLIFKPEDAIVPILGCIVMLIQWNELKLVNVLESVSKKLKGVVLTSILWSACIILTLVLSPAGMPPFIYFSY